MYKVVLVQGPTWTCLVLIDSKVKRALIIYSRGAEPSEPWGRGGPHPGTMSTEFDKNSSN